MAGVEVVGLVASVLQIADLGVRLSVKLYGFSHKVKHANKSIETISQEIALTGNVLQLLNKQLEQEKHLPTHEAVKTAQSLVDGCRKIFSEIDDVLDNKAPATAGLGWLNKLKTKVEYPFLESQIELLRCNLDRLKSSLNVMLNVLILAEHTRNRVALPFIQDQYNLIQLMVKNQNNAEERLEKLQIAFECNTLCTEAKTGKQTNTEPAHIGRLAEGTRDVLGNEAKNGNQAKIQPSHSGVIFEETRDVLGTAPTLQSPEDISTWSADGLIESSESPLSRDLSIKSYSRQIGTFYRSEVDASHREELDHHSRLVTALIDDINDVQYHVNNHLRQVMWDGNLGLHFNYWSPYRSRYGDAVLLDIVSPYADLHHFWVTRCSAAGERSRGKVFQGPGIAAGWYSSDESAETAMDTSRRRRRRAARPGPRFESPPPGHNISGNTSAGNQVLQGEAVGAVVGGLIEGARSRSQPRNRERSRSRLRAPLKVAAAGLGSAAVAGIYERNIRKKETEHRVPYNRVGSKSRTSAGPYHDGSNRDAVTSETDSINVMHAEAPVEGNDYGADYYGHFYAAARVGGAGAAYGAREARDRSRSGSRNRSRSSSTNSSDRFSLDGEKSFERRDLRAPPYRRDDPFQTQAFRGARERKKHIDDDQQWLYHCPAPDCDRAEGFKSAGWLLRHHLEAHTNMSKSKKPLLCPFMECNRYTGVAFSRGRSLKTHIRRHHALRSGRRRYSEDEEWTDDADSDLDAAEDQKSREDPRHRSQASPPRLEGSTRFQASRRDAPSDSEETKAATAEDYPYLTSRDAPAAELNKLLASWTTLSAEEIATMSPGQGHVWGF